jgi:hypothetical protein
MLRFSLSMVSPGPPRGLGATMASLPSSISIAIVVTSTPSSAKMPLAPIWPGTNGALLIAAVRLTTPNASSPKMSSMSSDGIAAAAPGAAQRLPRREAAPMKRPRRVEVITGHHCGPPVAGPEDRLPKAG